MQSVSQKIRTGLLELRTPNRVLYARPTFRERLYLLWIFRHFRSLSRQVLSHRQQQLIDRLAQTAEALNHAHVARASILGAVENVRLSAAVPVIAPASVNNVIEISSSQARISVASAVGSDLAPAARKPAQRPDREAKTAPRTSTRVWPIAARKAQPVTNDAPLPASPTRNLSSAPPRRWLEWASGAALGIALIGVLLYVSEVRPSSISSNARPSAATQQHSQGHSRIPSPVVSPSSASKTVAAETAPASPDPAPRVVSAGMPSPPPSVGTEPRIERTSPPLELASTARLQISGAPARIFVYPEAPNSTLTGAVNLRALISPDGTVERVDVLSGTPALARPAVEAVRRWRYLPPASAGQAREAETRVTINFVGDDAVSITFPSVQN
jgi:TonB family protein